MKKVLTILVIIALVCGAAFADETHKIHVKASVAETVPAFQLTYNTVTTNKPEQGEATKFSATGSYAPNTADADAVDTGKSLDENFSVEVTVTLANAAKQVQPYTLTFSDGVFTVKRNKVEGPLTPAIAAHAAAASVTGASLSASGAVITATFNGTKATAGTVLGTATYSYTGENTIDPGTYYADIKMTIAAV